MAICVHGVPLVYPCDRCKEEIKVLADEATKPTNAKTLVEEAIAAVTGARRGAYGTPENNFERIARYWNAHRANTGRPQDITAADVSKMMRLMKEARLDESPTHRDSFVDIIGYTLTDAEIVGVESIMENVKK